MGCEIDMAPGRLGVIADLPRDPQAGSDHLDAVGVTAEGGQGGAQGVAGVCLLGSRAHRPGHRDGLLGVAAR